MSKPLTLTPARIVLYIATGLTLGLVVFQILLANKVIEYTADTAAVYVDGYSYKYQSHSKVGKIRLPSGDHYVWTEKIGDTMCIRMLREK